VPADEGTAPGKEVAEDFIRDYMGTVEGMLRDVEVKR
jgi:hypothetical protein